jgi:hypothetical protein
MQRSHWHSECSDCSECSICWGNRKCQPRQQLQGGGSHFEALKEPCRQTSGISPF